MITLPEVPDFINRLPRDERGYPVPWFVAWLKDGKLCPQGEGEPDFRVIAPGKLWDAHMHARCWICGLGLGDRRVYLIGPMCLVTRRTSEPASHRRCAEFAAMACPFLTRPKQKRDYKNLIENRVVAGKPIERNPGVVCLYETNHRAKPFRSGDGWLFDLPKPKRLDFYAYGRKATRAEIDESIRTGLPLLAEEARKDAGGMEALSEMHAAALKLLPAA